jgi:hypothetical protein
MKGEKNMNHATIIKRFSEGKTSGTASNLFIEGDTLYSYGHHFPLLVRMPWGNLRNADKYSVTTSGHQNMVQHITTVSIPFIVFRSAGIHYQDIQLIDKAEARYDDHTYVNVKGETVTVNERRPESCVIRDPGSKKYFLCSMDNRNYFMSELPGKPRTIDAAFNSLLPDKVKGLVPGKYLRQGEWFFIPIDQMADVKIIGKGSEKQVKPLTYWQNSDNEVTPGRWTEGTQSIPVKFLHNRHTDQQDHHYATEYGRIRRHMAGSQYDGPLVVRGTVRHVNHDHPMLKLGDGRQWFEAVESKHVISYGVNGNVD